MTLPVVGCPRTSPRPPRGDQVEASGTAAGVSAAPRYVGWRVADMAAFPNANERQGNGTREGEPYVIGTAGGVHAYRKGVCSVCGELVWYQPAHLEHRVLVCWPCAGGDMPAPTAPAPADVPLEAGVAGDTGPSAPRLSSALGSVLATIRDLRASERERLADLRDETRDSDLEAR